MHDSDSASMRTIHVTRSAVVRRDDGTFGLALDTIEAGKLFIPLNANGCRILAAEVANVKEAIEADGRQVGSSYH
jgi:hypothetical protein